MFVLGVCVLDCHVRCLSYCGDSLEATALHVGTSQALCWFLCPLRITPSSWALPVTNMLRTSEYIWLRPFCKLQPTQQSHPLIQADLVLLLFLSALFQWDRPLLIPWMHCLIPSFLRAWCSWGAAMAPSNPPGLRSVQCYLLRNTYPFTLSHQSPSVALMAVAQSAAACARLLSTSLSLRCEPHTGRGRTCLIFCFPGA